jgi:hypothetical protein
MPTPDEHEREAIERAEAIGASDAVEPLPPLPVKEVPALAATVTDLTSLRTAVVDAAGVSAGLWLSYLFVLFYLLVAAGAVTHKDLFFESPVKLPFLGIDLPLKGFFVLGPGLFLIVHTYILLHFSLLAGKVQTFNRELWTQIDDAAIRSGVRQQLPANIFVQFLAGPSGDRNGVVGFFLWSIASISLAIGPIGLLLFFELQFLPYHHEGISNWHRIAVGLDLALMWMFWWRIALNDGAPPDRNRAWDRWFPAALRGMTWAAMAGLTVFSAVLLVGIATFPGETIEAWYGRQTYLPYRAGIETWRKFLVAGDVNPATRAPESLWSNRLVLPGLDVVVHLKLDSEAKIDFLPETVSLRNRNLDGAVLTDAVLRKADFTGAFLRGARLEGANLRQTKLECGFWSDIEQRKKDKKPIKPICAQLQDASLNFAHLQGALLDGAELQGASLNGNSLDGTQLQGASLNSAQLQGASLEFAQLQGASLDFAQLQGASLEFAQLQGASLQKTLVWRTDIRSADTTNAWIDPVEPYRSVRCEARAKDFICDWTAQTLKQLTDTIVAAVPEGPSRQAALERIDPRLNPAPTEPDTEGLAIDAFWNKRDTTPPPIGVYEVKVAEEWQKAGCAADGAPHVVARLARRLLGLESLKSSPFSENSPQPAQLAADFLADGCAGARGLPEEIRAKLRTLLPTVAPPAR